jgi:hypothetical protein
MIFFNEEKNPFIYLHMSTGIYTSWLIFKLRTLIKDSYCFSDKMNNYIFRLKKSNQPCLNSR